MAAAFYKIMFPFGNWLCGNHIYAKLLLQSYRTLGILGLYIPFDYKDPLKYKYSFESLLRKFKYKYPLDYKSPWSTGTPINSKAVVCQCINGFEIHA